MALTMNPSGINTFDVGAFEPQPVMDTAKSVATDTHDKKAAFLISLIRCSFQVSFHYFLPIYI